MAYTGMVALRTAVGNLEVSGIAATGRLQQAPDTITRNLPISFPRVPTTVESENVAFSGAAGLKTGAMEYVVVVEAANLSTHGLNLTAICTLIDAIDTALRSNINALGLDTWSIRVDTEVLGGNPYWVLVATLNVSG